MLKVLITGPAGSGKGTMSELIVDKYAITHISTGDMFRDEITNKTPLGLKASEYISKGLLVPDELTIEMVKNRLSKDDCKNGYLLDGFPRSLVQAEAIDDLKINCVINLTIAEEILYQRIVNRRLCKSCGEIYNISSKPSQIEGICDKCGGPLYQRNDDTAEKLKVRLDSYHHETEPVIEYYRQQNIVYDIDSSGKIEDIFQNIEKALDEVKEIN